MNRYGERKLNEEKTVSDCIIDHITFDAKHQRYIATGFVKRKNTGIINCSDLKCVPFHNKLHWSSMGVCVQPLTNNVLICVPYYGCVQIFDSDARLLYNVGTDVHESPRAVCCGVDGSFVVAEPVGKKLTFYTADVKQVRLVEEIRMTSICYMDRRFSPSASATLLLGGSNHGETISVFSSDASQQITEFDLSAHPRDVCVDMNGYVCVTACGVVQDNASLCIFEPRMNYALVQKIGIHGAPSNTMGGLCVNDVNELAISDLGSRVLRFLD